MRSPDEGSQGPVIRDRRRIDPATGQVRDAERSGGQGQADQPQRASGQNRPGRHAVSKPGRGSGGPPGSGASGRGNGPQAPVGGPDSADSGASGPSGGMSGPGSPGSPADPGSPATPGGSGGGMGSQSAAPAPESGPVAAGAEVIAARLAERTADLQRLQAEYANYRKRVERDRMAVREQALANVLTELLPILDDIGRAREHGELTGGFKSVAESLEGAAVKLGLTRYGEDGDPFDPKLHEALMHSYSRDVAEPTCVRILQPGYKVADRILRPARVAVAEPGEPDEPDDPSGQGPNSNRGDGDGTRSFPHRANDDSN
jgi:molecular chaperone GrpE